MTDVIRYTIDIPVDLHEKINEAVKRTSLSKAQYMRMGIEVLGLLAGMDGELYLHTSDGRRPITIPGVLPHA